MGNNINSRVLENAESFFAWDVLAWLVVALILAFVIVGVDSLFFAKNSNVDDENAKKSKLGKFFYFLIFLKFSKNETHAHRPKLVQWSIQLFPIFLLVILIRGFVFEPFRVPSNSMMPTLLTGDFIVVNKFDYGLRLPVTNTSLIKFSAPERGDVVIFRYPNYERNKAYLGVDFVKRIIGLPGDKISYLKDRLTINGHSVAYRDIGIYEGVDSGRHMSGYHHLKEKIEGGNHNVILSPIQFSSQFSEIIVPEGHYFVMGDNRSNSSDSRFWGYVPESYIIGRVMSIWMHWDFNYNTMQFSRIGGIE